MPFGFAHFDEAGTMGPDRAWAARVPADILGSKTEAVVRAQGWSQGS